MEFTTLGEVRGGGERERNPIQLFIAGLIYIHIRIVLLAKNLLKILTGSVYKQFEDSYTTIFIAVFKK